MKNLSRLATIGLLLVCFSCKKPTPYIQPNTGSLTGTWELTESYGGGSISKAYPPGNNNIIRFTDSTYQNYANGVLLKSGLYTIVKDTSVMTSVGLVIPNGQYTQRIIFDGDVTSVKTFYQFLNGQLDFLSGYFPTDGGTGKTYKKQLGIR